MKAAEKMALVMYDRKDLDCASCEECAKSLALQYAQRACEAYVSKDEVVERINHLISLHSKGDIDDKNLYAELRCVT